MLVKELEGSKYQPLYSIASGSYSSVFAARDKLSGDKVAIKQIYSPFSTLRDASLLLREVRIMRHFNNAENV